MTLTIWRHAKKKSNLLTNFAQSHKQVFLKVRFYRHILQQNKLLPNSFTKWPSKNKCRSHHIPVRFASQTFLANQLCFAANSRIVLLKFSLYFLEFRFLLLKLRPLVPGQRHGQIERFSRQQKRTCNNSTLLDVLSLALVTLKVLLVADAINPLGLSPEFCKPLLPRSHAPMALVHNAGKLKFGAEKKGKKRKNVFDQLDTLELAANGPREHI
jgi:hypothetical protein